MLQFEYALREIRKAFRRIYEWREVQKSRSIADFSDCAVFTFAAGAGLVAAIDGLSVKELFPQYEKLVGYLAIMPLKIMLATLLVTIALLAWSIIGFSFSLLCAYYSKEFMRRLES